MKKLIYLISFILLVSCEQEDLMLTGKMVYRDFCAWDNSSIHFYEQPYYVTKINDKVYTINEGTKLEESASLISFDMSFKDKSKSTTYFSLEENSLVNNSYIKGFKFPGIHHRDDYNCTFTGKLLRSFVIDIDDSKYEVYKYHDNQTVHPDYANKEVEYWECTIYFVKGLGIFAVIANDFNIGYAVISTDNHLFSNENLESLRDSIFAEFKTNDLQFPIKDIPKHCQGTPTPLPTHEITIDILEFAAMDELQKNPKREKKKRFGDTNRREND